MSASHQQNERDHAAYLADGAVHAVGLAAGLIGGVALVVIALRHADALHTAGAVIYVASLLASFAASAAYNMWPNSPVKARLRKLDHAAIYALIAGTYTPFALQIDTVGNWLLVWIWGLAGLGILMKVISIGRFDKLSVLLYLALAWSGVLIFDDMMATLGPQVVSLIVIGGLIYSAGVILYLWQGLRFQRALWHLCVLVAAGFHFSAVTVAITGLSSA
ncbi:hemolysin III family protein [Georhizobium sp. MAB10]|jgi:hemolysin III|uniref:PAQR family membrane homeostasis protein TrhA n=1 Tax=Georhizobium sp. MAB10 TaxID=3028319 RepID=UPI0038560965